MVDHLVGLGHRRIAHVDGGSTDLSAERCRGYEQAMRRQRLKPLVLAGGETPEDGYAAASSLTDYADVTAAVAFNDLCALGLIDGLLARGVDVPRDMSVTGFDDDWIASHGRIALTTINPSARDQARRAVELAVERLEVPRTEDTLYVAPTTLVVRGSTSAPRDRPSRRRGARI